MGLKILAICCWAATKEVMMTMSKIHIKYMTDEALETLKANTSVITERLTENQISSTQLSEFIPSELYVTKKYEIEEFTLRVPKDEKDRETDIYNSILLYERLHHLPLYVLTDERFWCWMNFEMGYEVALKYMPVKKNSSVFKDHWLLTQGKRRGLFFGVLSRCYFRVALSVDNTLDDPYELTKFVIENPLRFRELTWQSFSSEKMIVLGYAGDRGRRRPWQQRREDHPPDWQERGRCCRFCRYTAPP